MQIVSVQVLSYQIFWPKSKTSKKLGPFFETQACLELKGLGWSVLDRNYRSLRGEIDIIALKDRLLWFVEVRFREDGSAWDSITTKKKKSLTYTAQQYLAEKEISYDEATFVVCGIDSKGVDWLENAFDEIE